MLKPLEFTQISSDAFKSWSRCKRQYYYKHVKKMQWPADIQHFSLGKDVHKLMDYQARGMDCTLLLDKAAQNVRVSWQKLMAHPMAHLPVIVSEWAFHVPLPLDFGETKWLTGRIDRVARHESELLVIDWKTGTGVPRNPEADWQTRLYLYALVEVAQTASATDLGLNMDGPLKPEQLRFVYVEVKADSHTPVREVVVHYGQSKHEATRQTLKAMLSAIDSEEEFALPENNQCPDKFCAYRTICGIEPPTAGI